MSIAPDYLLGLEREITQGRDKIDLMVSGKSLGLLYRRPKRAKLRMGKRYVSGHTRLRTKCENLLLHNNIHQKAVTKEKY